MRSSADVFTQSKGIVMFKYITALVSAAILASPQPALALQAKVVSSNVQVQSPCRDRELAQFGPCVVKDVVFDASAPRNDVTFDLTVARPALINSRRAVVVYNFKITNRYFNNRGVVTVWDQNNNRLGQYSTVNAQGIKTSTMSVAMVTQDGGRTWSEPMVKDDEFTTDLL